MAFKYFVREERTEKVNMTFSYTGAKFQMRSWTKFGGSW